MNPEPFDTWTVAEPSFDGASAKTYEGIFTLGNGYMHVRGSLEELLSGEIQNRCIPPGCLQGDAPSDPIIKVGTFVPGLLGTAPSARRQIVNLPYFFDLTLSVGAEQLDMRLSRTCDYVRHLDMQSAVLKRSLTWQPQAGGEVAVTHERFISAARSHLAVQRMSVRPDRDMQLTVAGGINADVTTVNWDMFKDVTLQRTAAGRVACGVETNLGSLATILCEMRYDGFVQWRYRHGGQLGRLVGSLTIPAGKTVTIEKRIALTTSRDLDSTTVDAELQAVGELSYDDLLTEHADVWRDRWQRSDVEIDGDDDSQRALRHSLYHLHRSLVRGDSRVAVGAKGYAGELYQGLFFWDTEMFLLPFQLYTDPDAARSLCDYRIQALPGAKRVAARYGYDGARYPWTADDAGDECCEPWIFKDSQLHVTVDVVYGLAHWATASDEPDYLTGPAAEALLETARYWLDRIDRRSGDDRPHLLGVMGPDEFTAFTSNNSYTNRLVRFAMELAAELGPQIGASPDEVQQFRRVAENLPMPRREDGLVLQCEEFDRFAEIDIEGLWKDRSIPFEWQVPRERIHHCKVLKQADVLMLMLLFPQEYSDAEVQAAWDYYHPLTTHDSSLSPGVHAIIAARLGMMDIAEEYWRRTVGLDLRPGHGGARDGIHIACCGASWQMAVFGFAGMQTALQSETFTLDSRLPKAWRRLSFPVVWKRQPLRVTITPEDVTIANDGDADLSVNIVGQSSIVPAGRSHTFSRTAQEVAG